MREPDIASAWMSAMSGEQGSDVPAASQQLKTSMLKALGRLLDGVACACGPSRRPRAWRIS
ncbi:hypothetical protein ACRS6B_14920 [Nocardia asteroides]